MAGADRPQPDGLTMPRSVHLGLRVIAAILGGYACAFGLAAAIAASAHVGSGLGFHEAEQLGHLLALLLYPALMLWTLATPRLLRAFLLQAGSAGGLMLLALWLQNLMLHGGA
ncbi:hypothetical protein CO611_01285 [Lysobacteraceae bacterium NML03-0222]|nr:hypothetical protein CO611_01285 [Xanthomonadaceae bacterium NML03-0222]